MSKKGVFFLPDQVFEASGGSWTLRVTREAPAVLPGLRVMSRNRYDRSHLASRYSRAPSWSQNYRCESTQIDANQ